MKSMSLTPVTGSIPAPVVVPVEVVHWWVPGTQLALQTASGRPSGVMKGVQAPGEGDGPGEALVGQATGAAQRPPLQPEVPLPAQILSPATQSWAQAPGILP